MNDDQFQDDILNVIEQEILLITPHYSGIFEYSAEISDTSLLIVKIEYSEEVMPEQDIDQMLDKLYDDIQSHEGDPERMQWTVESKNYTSNLIFNIQFEVPGKLIRFSKIENAIVEHNYYYNGDGTAKLWVKVTIDSAEKLNDVGFNQMLTDFNSKLSEMKNSSVEESFEMCYEGLSMKYFGYYWWKVEDWVQWNNFQDRPLCDYYIERDGDTFSITLVSYCCRVWKNTTLSEFAERFDTTVEALVSLNGIKDPNKIYVGDVLRYR